MLHIILLMLGIIVALFALAAPGTGILEAGAMLVLAVAAYAVYQLGVNLWGLIVLIISLVPFVYAVRKPKRKVFLILGVLGIAVGSAYLFPTNGFLPAVNWLLAIITSAHSRCFCVVRGRESDPGGRKKATSKPRLYYRQSWGGQERHQ